MTYRQEAGLTVSVATPQPRWSRYNSEHYLTPELNVDVLHRHCTDANSGKVYAQSVDVETGGRIVSGCGGDIVPPIKLADTTWKIMAIDQLPTPKNQQSGQVIF